MSRATLLYTTFASPSRRRERLGRWTWTITDGLTGPVLLSGTARTAWGASRRIERALSRCCPARPGPKRPLSPTAATSLTERLHADGIPVTVCAGDCVEVCADCPVTTEQEVAALTAVLAATDQRVKWREAVAR